ncbi:MAG: hypothetical protein HYR83_13825 [Planctomycetes bacterium]|nr:hypothetical protein [Planctomycetota bacterium]
MPDTLIWGFAITYIPCRFPTFRPSASTNGDHPTTSAAYQARQHAIGKLLIVRIKMHEHCTFGAFADHQFQPIVGRMCDNLPLIRAKQPCPLSVQKMYKLAELACGMIKKEGL